MIHRIYQNEHTNLESNAKNRVKTNTFYDILVRKYNCLKTHPSTWAQGFSSSHKFFKLGKFWRCITSLTSRISFCLMYNSSNLLQYWKSTRVWILLILKKNWIYLLRNYIIFAIIWHNIKRFWQPARHRRVD